MLGNYSTLAASALGVEHKFSTQMMLVHVESYMFCVLSGGTVSASWAPSFRYFVNATKAWLVIKCHLQQEAALKCLMDQGLEYIVRGSPYSN